MTPVRFIAVIAAIALGAAGLYFGSAPEESPTAAAYPKQKGVCWVGSRQQVTQEHLLNLRDNGVTWISQTPFGWQRDAMVPDIRFQTGSDRIMWGESFAGLAATTSAASSLGIHTMLKPHLWVHDTWAGAVEMQNEEDWKKWFESYERFILTYARFADSLHIEMLCIGTELEKTSRRAEWIPLIAKIRQHYRGKITYAANFSEFEHVTFWPYLDYIGIQGYFPLTDERKPSLEELMDGWRKPIARVEKIQRKYNKAVIFTELGYKSTEDAGIEPWRWPQHVDKEAVCTETQANCYEAFFRSLWNKNWVAGVYFWKWYPTLPSRSIDADFTPQRKPAEKVMAQWFGPGTN